MRTTLALLGRAVIDQRPGKFFRPSSWAVIIITYFRYGAGVALTPFIHFIFTVPL